jgi:hypothetical protein
MVSVTMKAKNPGTWLYHCHVTDHITAGMITRWTVRDEPRERRRDPHWASRRHWSMKR